MKILKASAIDPFAIELYANSKYELNDYFGTTHPGLTKYKLFLNPDSSVILHCKFSGEEQDTYLQLESSKEFDFVMNDFF